MPADWNPDRHIDAMAALLGIPVTPEQRPGIRRFLLVAKGMAERLEADRRPDTLDLAPVFMPVEPGPRGTER